MLLLSQKDRDRLLLLHQVRDRALTLSAAARRAGLTTRQFRRLVRRFELLGDVAVVHRARGRPPNNARSVELREQALALARDPLYADFGPTLLAEHLARRGVDVHPHTLRRWMIQDGHWQTHPRGQRHRRHRERRHAFGELVLMDTSIHPWLEARMLEPIVLIALIDDATGRLFCRFFSGDTGAANRRMLVDYLECFGRPGAFYTDQAGHFKVHFSAKALRQREEPERLTLIRRALDVLEIELILALSPQAKGRVERLFKTLQDRLVKELRVAGICTLADANTYLEESFIPFWNERFTVQPVEAADAHRPLAPDVDLLSIFAVAEPRVIRSDFTFRYNNQHFQIERSDAEPAMPGTSLIIEERLDGSRHFLWRSERICPTPIPARPTPVSQRRKPTPPPPRPLPPDHPWRRRPVAVGRAIEGWPVVASASLRPDTPALGAAD